MSVWTREEDTFLKLDPERQANIEIVGSAYASVAAEKAYLTMPVTTGPRFYDVLDRYGVKTVEELERKRPGALREEIILPNIESGKALAAKIRQDHALDAIVVPGVFEARKQRWSQDEYMVLWLRFITGSASAVYLSDGWAYSNGGAIEFARAYAKRWGHVGDVGLFDWSLANAMKIFDHEGNEVDIVEPAARLAEAIRDLARRGYDTATLRHELATVGQLTWDNAERVRCVHVARKVGEIVDSVASIH